MAKAPKETTDGGSVDSLIADHDRISALYKAGKLGADGQEAPANGANVQSLVKNARDAVEAAGGAIGRAKPKAA